MLKYNTELLFKSLEIAKLQKNLKRFVFFSTSEVYAFSHKSSLIKFPTPENSLILTGELSDKRNTYSLSKIFGESLTIHSNIPYTIFRPHNIYGPRMGMSHVIPQIMERIYKHKGGYFDLRSSNHTRSFCYVNDCVDIINKILLSNKSLNKTINLGNNNEEISIRDLVSKISEKMKIKININEINEEIGSTSRRLPDISLQQKITNNFNFKFNLETGLEKTISWYNKFYFS